MPGRKLLYVGKAQLTGYLLELANVCWCGTQVPRDNLHDVIENTANEASVSTATPDKCVVLTTQMWSMRGIVLLFAAL